MRRMKNGKVVEKRETSRESGPYVMSWSWRGTGVGCRLNRRPRWVVVVVLVEAPLLVLGGQPGRCRVPTACPQLRLPLLIAR